MSPALVLPIVLSALLGLLGPAAARRSGHAAAVRLLPLTCLLVAGSTVMGVATVAVSALAGVGEVAELGRWSVRALPAAWRAVPVPVGLLAGTVVLVLLTGAGWRASELVRQLLAAGRACRAAGSRTGGVVVVHDGRPHAFAVAGVRGGVVVSTGMLHALDASGCRALLAHERSHLRRRHHLSLIAVQLAAAADPLLRPLVAVTAHAVEREADEDAARTVGDRRTVAIAVARAALATAHRAPDAALRPARPGALPAATSGEVSDRVAALLAPPVRSRRLAPAALLLVAVLAAWPSAVSGLAADRHLDHARAAYRPADAEQSWSAVARLASVAGDHSR